MYWGHVYIYAQFIGHMPRYSQQKVTNNC